MGKLRSVLPALFLGVALAVVGCGRSYPKPNLEFSSLKEISNFARKEFEHVDDFYDEWQSVGKTYSSKAGDCDDFAIFSAYYASKLEYKTSSLFFRRGLYDGHTIALVESSDGKFGFVERGDFAPPIFESVGKLASFYNNVDNGRYEGFSIHRLDFSKNPDYVTTGRNLKLEATGLGLFFPSPIPSWDPDKLSEEEKKGLEGFLHPPIAARSKSVSKKGRSPFRWMDWK
jgi:hypothetical protein